MTEKHCYTHNVNMKLRENKYCQQQPLHNEGY